MMIPARKIAALGARVDGVLMRRLPRQSEALQLLRGYIQTLRKGKLIHAEAPEIVGRHLIDLAALAVTSHRPIGEISLSAVAAARLDAAIQHIAARFCNPDLNVAAVARDMGISPRYLQRLLETGISFTERVNELRLKKAFALLTEAADGPRRISDIAFEVGFSDISHFNRLFRSRFGDTPHGVRGQRSI